MISVRTAALFVAGAVAGGLLIAPPAKAEYFETKLLKTTINNGKPIVMGTSGSATVRVPVTIEVSGHPGGLPTMSARLDTVGGYFWTFLERQEDRRDMTCELPSSVPSPSPSFPADSTATFTCTGVAIVRQSYVHNIDAGLPVQLHVWGYTAESVHYSFYSALTDSVPLLKQSTMTTANATPEPVRKNGTLTVRGKLSQPDWSYWDANNNKMSVGYGGQPVALQFRKAGATTYRTVKTVTSAKDGTLKTTVKATASGAWRWSFAGSSTTAGSASAGDNVALYKVAKLTVNASPEPVAKGGKLKVTGRLTRATTDSATSFTGYAKQRVKLQFRKRGSSTYKTVKTVYTDSRGRLTTTTTARAAGYWRWSYAGSSTVASVSAAGDYVAVK